MVMAVYSASHNPWPALGPQKIFPSPKLYPEVSRKVQPEFDVWYVCQKCFTSAKAARFLATSGAKSGKMNKRFPW